MPLRLTLRSGDAFELAKQQASLADALFQAGRRGEAKERFRVAEEINAGNQPHHQLLYSGSGFRYCELLLDAPERAAWQRTLTGSHFSPASSDTTTKSPQPAVVRTTRAQQPSATLQDTQSALLGRDIVDARIQRCRAVVHRASQTLAWVTAREWLLDIALDNLILGRAALYEAILAGSPFDASRALLQVAITGLRRAGELDLLPQGLLTRAWLRSLAGARTGPESAKDDLDESWEIAVRGPMPLFVADIHLHRARLFFGEQPYPWESARADLKEARRLIERHGYWRRKQELEDAEGVEGNRAGE